MDINNAVPSPAQTSNPVPDLGNLAATKTSGALVDASGKDINTSKEGAVNKTATPSVDKTEVKEAIQKIKLGEEEYTIAELQALKEKAKGADKKFLEANKAKKEAMKVFKMAKENPKEFLRITGQDPAKFAYDEVASDIKNKLRDPREVALEEANKKLEQYEAEKQQANEVKKQANIDKQAKALEQKFHSEMIEALEAFPELPKNPYTVAQLARAIDQVRTKHGVLLTAKEVAPLVIKDVRNTVAGVIKGSTPEMLEALIGKEGIDALLKHSMSKLKDPLKNGQGAVNTSGEQKPEQKKWKTSHEYWKSIDRAAKEERERGNR